MFTGVFLEVSSPRVMWKQFPFTAQEWSHLCCLPREVQGMSQLGFELVVVLRSKPAPALLHTTGLSLHSVHTTLIYTMLTGLHPYKPGPNSQDCYKKSIWVADTECWSSSTCISPGIHTICIHDAAGLLKAWFGPHPPLGSGQAQSYFHSPMWRKQIWWQFKDHTVS